MRLLALDAALGPCSVALVTQAGCLGERHGAESRSATATLPILMRDLLAGYGDRFDAVAVTVGPGSFTGLRGALSLAHGLALGAGVPIVGVTVAEALLADAPPLPGTLWVALDSGRSERIFLCQEGAVTAVELSNLPKPAGAVHILGDAAPAVVELLRRTGAEAICAGTGSVSAWAVGRVGLRRLAGTIPPCDAQPLYIEPPGVRVGSGLRPPPV